MFHTLRQHLKGDHSVVTIVVVTFLLLNLLLITLDALATIIGVIDDPVIRNRLYFIWLAFQFVFIFPFQWISLVQSSRFQIKAFKNYGGVVLSVIFGFIFTGVLFHYNFPNLNQIKHSLNIALSQDGFKSSISVEGNVLKLSGTLEFGSAKEVELAINNSNIRLLELDITAGQLYEARILAKLVSELKLNVFVPNRCLTPCTLILASGSQRLVSTSAEIGFQGYKILYPNEKSDWFVEQEQKRDIKWLKAKNVVESFVYQTFYSRTNQEFWYPQLSRLVEVGYIDQVVVN